MLQLDQGGQLTSAFRLGVVVAISFLKEPVKKFLPLLMTPWWIAGSTSGGSVTDVSSCHSFQYCLQQHVWVSKLNAGPSHWQGRIHKCILVEWERWLTPSTLYFSLNGLELKLTNNILQHGGHIQLISPDCAFYSGLIAVTQFKGGGPPKSSN